MTETEVQEPWRELLRLAEEGQLRQLDSYLRQLPPSDVALAISRLSENEQTLVLGSLEPEDAAGVVEQLPAVQAAGLMENLEPQSAAAILDELPSNDQADLINDLDDEDAEAILGEMDPAVAEEVRALAAYAADTAGGLMVREFLKYAEESTVDEVVADLRENADRYADYDIQYAYVCDAQDRLSGVLRLRDLLLSPRARRIGQLMISAPLSVRDHAPLDELVDLLDSITSLVFPSSIASIA